MTKATRKTTVDAPPEALEDIWDEGTATAFRALRLEHQAFLLHYVQNGFNGAEAYRQAYTHPDCDNQVASSSASRLLRNVHIRAVLDKLKDDATEDFFLCLKVNRDACRASADPEGKFPDHDIRLKGGAALSKLRGFNAPEKVQDDRLTALLSHMNRTKEAPNAEEAKQPPARTGKPGRPT